MTLFQALRVLALVLGLLAIVLSLLGHGDRVIMPAIVATLLALMEK